MYGVCNVAKVVNPLFADFYEAVGSTIVFQRRYGTDVIARKKVRHAEDPTSAHTKARAHKWGQGVRAYVSEDNPGDTLLQCISRYALSPDAPKNVDIVTVRRNQQNSQLFDITLGWDQVTNKYGGHPLDNLVGYFVNLSLDGLHWQRLNQTPITATSYTDTQPFQNLYYTVQAIDDQDNLSSESDIFVIDVSTLPRLPGM